MSIYDEVVEERRLAARYWRHIRVVLQMENQRRKADGRPGGRFYGHGYCRPSTDLLRQTYCNLCKKLDDRRVEACFKTSCERQVIELVRKSTSLKAYRSLWIGNFNFDLAFLQLAGVVSGKGSRRMRGLAIEVNGPVHDRGLKLAKDLHKQDFAHFLGLGLATIENCDVRHPTVLNLIRRLNKKCDRLDSRARKRLMRAVYVHTIAYHLSASLLGQLYQCAFISMLETAADRRLFGNFNKKGSAHENPDA